MDNQKQTGISVELLQSLVGELAISNRILVSENQDLKQEVARLREKLKSLEAPCTDKALKDDESASTVEKKSAEKPKNTGKK